MIPAGPRSSGEFWPLVLAAKYVLGNLVISCNGGFWAKGEKLDEGNGIILK